MSVLKDSSGESSDSWQVNVVELTDRSDPLQGSTRDADISSSIFLAQYQPAMSRPEKASYCT